MARPRSSASDRRRAAPLYLGALVASLLIAGWVSPFRSGEDGAPDLTVGFTNVPGTMHAGKSVLVEFQVDHLGTAPILAFEARLFLVSLGGPQETVTLMQSVRSTRFGEIQVAANVPADPGPGPWRLRVEVDPAPGEEALRNNIDVSEEVSVLTLDLAVLDASPIVLHPLSAADVLETEVLVINQGTPGGVLVFEAQVVGDAPWLTVDPSSSFALGGGAPIPLTLRCDPALMPQEGSSAVVRIANFGLPDDAVEIPVSVSIEPPTISAGWTIIGTLMPGADDEDEVHMEGVKGQLIKLDLKVTVGTWSPRVTFVAPTGDEEATLQYKTMTGKASKPLVRKTHKLQDSGVYRLRIGDSDQLGGKYKIKLHQKLPSKARKRKLTVVDGDAATEIRALAGASLNLQLDPNNHFEGPIHLGVTTPTGATYDLQAFVVPDGDGLLIHGLPIEQSGSFWVSIAGFGPASSAKVRIVAHPKSPPKSLFKLILP